MEGLTLRQKGSPESTRESDMPETILGDVNRHKARKDGHPMRAKSHTMSFRHLPGDPGAVILTVSIPRLLLRQETSSQKGNHGKHGRTRKGES
jgi:hypothetical protein